MLLLCNNHHTDSSRERKKSCKIDRSTIQYTIHNPIVCHDPLSLPTNHATTIPHHLPTHFYTFARYTFTFCDWCVENKEFCWEEGIWYIYITFAPAALHFLKIFIHFTKQYYNSHNHLLWLYEYFDTIMKNFILFSLSLMFTCAILLSFFSTTFFFLCLSYILTKLRPLHASYHTRRVVGPFTPAALDGHVAFCQAFFLELKYMR